jgi:hypothetical protein
VRRRQSLRSWRWSPSCKLLTSWFSRICLPAAFGSMRRGFFMREFEVQLHHLTPNGIDKILIYRYIKPQVQWFPNEEEPLTNPFWIAWGLCPSGTLARTFWQRVSAEPDSTAASAWGSRASPSLGLPIYDTSKASPCLLPG